jgi:hypothetical protein
LLKHSDLTGSKLMFLLFAWAIFLLAKAPAPKAIVAPTIGSASVSQGTAVIVPPLIPRVSDCVIFVWVRLKGQFF